MHKIAVAVVLALGSTTPVLAEITAIRAGHVITDASQPARGASTILVEKGRIIAINDAAAAIPAGATVVDLSGKTVMPGLIDAHVHLTGTPDGQFWQEAVTTDEYSVAVGLANAATTLRAGFTTVRDLGSPKLAGFAVRDAIANGLEIGPRMLASGPAISIIGGHGDVSGYRPEVNAALAMGNTCTGADQCAARVREASRAGADVIKITATGGVLSQQARGLGQHFTDAEMRAIVTTAHGLGLKVAAHAHGARGDIALRLARGVGLVVDVVAHDPYPAARLACRVAVVLAVQLPGRVVCGGACDDDVPVGQLQPQCAVVLPI
ncbi:MAG TPA: amidohydrolase family protein, partial [Polymorphobacter sp.]|nr:amidohydrolase family protein [Polymorphobacter sp.]